jgi:acetyl esterase
VATTPCAHVLTARYDPLRDEGEAYAARLAQVGVTTVYRCYEGQMHGFFSLPGFLPVAEEATGAATHELRQSFRRVHA